MSSSLATASASRLAKQERLLLLSVDCCIGAGRFPLFGMVLKKSVKRPFNYCYEEINKSGITTPTVVRPETGNGKFTSTQTMLDKLIRE